MEPIIRHNFTRFKLIVVLLCLSLTTSCVNLMHLDRAQNQFNQGATIENQLRFNPQSDAPTSPSLYYNLAYSAVNKALQNKPALEKDDLLSNAYTIKALCEWKLKRYLDALQSSKSALVEYTKLEEKGILMPRDKVLMQALPLLMEIEKVKNDLFSFHTAKKEPFDAAQRHYLELIFNPSPDKTGKLEEVSQKLGEIRDRMNGNDDLSVYFLVAQLAALKTWSDAFDFLRQSIITDSTLTSDAKQKAEDARKEQRKQTLEPQKAELLAKLEKIVSGQPGEDLVNYWRKLI